MQATKVRKHAQIRISERLFMSNEEFLLLLENGSVPIGKDGTHVHYLFYEMESTKYFVAVQDDNDGQVITVLPVDYHNRWRISDDVLQTAKQHAERYHNYVMLKNLKAARAKERLQAKQEKDYVDTHIVTIFIGYENNNKQYITKRVAVLASKLLKSVYDGSDDCILKYKKNAVTIRTNVNQLQLPEGSIKNLWMESEKNGKSVLPLSLLKSK